jgi:hypothetical protein
MDGVLTDARAKFPNEELRVGKRGNSIQRRSGDNWYKLCLKHGLNYYNCRKCRLVRGADENMSLEDEKSAIKKTLQQMRGRFPEYNLNVSARRVDGAHRIVRKYDNDEKYYRVCLKHGRLFKNCQACSFRFAAKPATGGNSTDGGKSSCRKTVLRRQVPKHIQQTFRYMKEAFPTATLRIGPSGRAIQKKNKGSNPLWSAVCAAHCVSMYSCRRCGKSKEWRAQKRQEMEPVLIEMRRRFPHYNLQLTSRMVEGSFKIVRIYKEGGKGYRICVPHGRLFKQCTGVNGCNQHAQAVRKKRHKKKRKRETQLQKFREKRRLPGFTLSDGSDCEFNEYSDSEDTPTYMAL